jgi:hypothetical protein
MAICRCLLAATIVLSLALAGSPGAMAAEPAKIDVDRYQEVELLTLRATPEKFKNKRIRTSTRYQSFRITFPEYMEKSGFKGDKHYLIQIIPRSLPVIAEKDDETTELIAPLKKGTIVVAYGKVREFRSKSKHMLPEYFLELEHLELAAADVTIELPPEIQAEEDAELPFFNVGEPPGTAPIRRIPRRRR